MKKIIIIFLLLIYIPVNAEKIEAQLSKCIDGDTATFTINGESKKTRFLAIDAPEIAKEDVEAEPLGDEASEYTCNKLKNAKKIELEYDDKSDKEDKFGRTLAWIWVDNKLLQEIIIKEGLAKVRYVYSKYKYVDILYSALDEAMNNKKGLWADYIPKTYTVTFIDGDNTSTIKVIENDTIEEIILNKEGYKFIGWYLNDHKFDFNTKITDNITLVAKYEKNINYLEIILIIIGCLLLLSIKPKYRKKKRKR